MINNSFNYSPNVVSGTEKGVKLDYDKPDLSLVLNDFSRALFEVGKVGTFGAKKYCEHGWLEVPNGIRRYDSALLRHNFLVEIEGDYDVETGLLHYAHRAWNALATLELKLRDIEEQNRISDEIIDEVLKEIEDEKNRK